MAMSAGVDRREFLFASAVGALSLTAASRGRSDESDGVARFDRTPADSWIAIST